MSKEVTNLKKALALVIEAMSLVTEDLEKEQRQREEGLAQADELIGECIAILNGEKEDERIQ